MAELPLVVAMTGASGAIYGKRLVEELLAAGREVHFTLSPSALEVIRCELQIEQRIEDFSPGALFAGKIDRLRFWRPNNLSAGIASGSFRTAAMAIVPCSMSTLSALATGNGTNLIHRAGEVHLKERRPLILTPRETPLSLIGLRNMVAVAEAGATVLPAMPGFYRIPTSIDDMVNFIVGRICDQLGVECQLTNRWGNERCDA